MSYKLMPYRNRWEVLHYDGTNIKTVFQSFDKEDAVNKLFELNGWQRKKQPTS